jgi:four helix bundle protein
MARDPTKLDAFRLADQFAIEVYEHTRRMSAGAGIRTPLRRAAISAPQNICEGCARRSKPEYARFLDIALSSASEALYVLGFCHRVQLLSRQSVEHYTILGKRTVQTLQKLIDAVAALP